MKKIKATKETILLALIVILSSVLNFVNLSIEGTANSYYAAAVKSMTVNFKNFFFVAFDPAGFMSIDKPPLGFWLQAISAKIFGFSGWSIILPQALAGVISVIIIYNIVKRAFGSAAGLISALCLAITPVFVAASRNNTVDNVLVLVLLLACYALTVAAEKGKFKYLLLSLVLVGIGFNVKMLQAYMVAPALYITYLLSTGTSIKKRIIHLAAGTVVLIAVSLSWALIVDSVPASSRPYVDSSTNNTVMELIVGHNGIERLSLSSNNSQGGGGQKGNGQPEAQQNNSKSSSENSNQTNSVNNNQTNSNNSNQANSQNSNEGMPGNPPSGNMQNGQRPSGNPPARPSGNPPSGDFKNGNAPTGGPQGGMGGNSGNLTGTFGGEAKSSITRLFSKNILSDQIVWFIPLAIFGFIAAAIKEKMKIKLDNKKKQSLMLWFMWFLPSFIYFSFNTGTFHSYYLTMLAPPTAALAGIGIVSMWELYKEGGWKAWFLPVALIANGIAQLLMLYYFISSSSSIKVLMVLLIILCFGSSLALIVLNILKKKDSKIIKALAAAALTGLLITPFVGSSTVLTHSLNGSFPAAGLELLSNSSGQMPDMGNTSGSKSGVSAQSSGNSKLIQFLLKNKTKNQKYLLVVANSNSGSDIIINSGEAVMSIGGFLGNDKSITLEQFKALVKKGEIRYVMTGGQGGQGGSGSASEIMNWVQQNGKAVSTSEYTDTKGMNSNSGTDQNSQNSNTQGSQSNTNSSDNNANENSKNDNSTNSNSQDGGFKGGNQGQLYDLIDVK